MKVFAKDYKDTVASLAHKVAIAEEELRLCIKQAPQFIVEPGLIFARYNPQTDCLDIEQNIPLNREELINFFHWLSSYITEEQDQNPLEAQAYDPLQADLPPETPF